MRTTPRPPLTKRLKPVHWTVIDYIVGGLLGLIVFVTVRVSMVTFTGPVAPGVAPGLLTLGLAVGVAILVGIRRRRPMLSLCLLLGGSALVALLSGLTGPTLIFFEPVTYVLYRIVASFENRRKVGQALIAVFLVVLADAAIMAPRNPGQVFDGGAFIPVILSIVVAWSIGYIVRQRRRYALGMQEEAASKAVAVERLRIARELHDVVAHSMSVIAVQAGYGQYVIDSQPADAREALGAIQATSREALEEMRRMLGALRYADEAASVAADAPGVPNPASVSGSAGPGSAGPDSAGRDSAGVYGAGASEAGAGAAGAGLAGLFRSGLMTEPAMLGAGSAAAPLFPAPGLVDLDRLLTRTAGAGVRAEVHRIGTPRDLPASIDLSAYRIIQEALTNVVKHAHASTCSVLLDYGENELTIEVTDSGAGVPAMAVAMAGGGARPARLAAIPSGGHGIIGMRERVSLLSGQFTAGPLPGYGFQVSARIPLPENGAR